MAKEEKVKNQDIFPKTEQRIIVIDGNAIVHRAFHALPPLTNKKGQQVGAVYGFLLFFIKAVKEFNPDFIAAAFDFPGPTIRHRKYQLYKAQRKKAPDELYEQIPKVKKILEDFGIQVFEKEGYEGDDIIGTIAKLVNSKRARPEIETIILSGDFDNLQLVDANTKVYAVKRGIKDATLYDAAKVKEKYEGLNPDQLPDLKALSGDASDNIPGVFGIGEKTATALINEFGSLENLYKQVKERSPDGLKAALIKKLLDSEEQAVISKVLGKIDCDVPINFDLEKCQWKGYEKDKALAALNDYGFRSLISRIVPSEKEQPVKEKKAQVSGAQKKLGL